MGGITHVVASLDDYETAVELSREVLGRVLTGITPKCEQMVTTIRDQLAGEEDFTVAQVVEAVGWSRDTVDKYLKEALRVGCLELTQGGTGRLHMYRFVKLAKQIEVRLPSREEIATFMEDKPS
jgi:response regulator of citrate/malate metabolism